MLVLSRKEKETVRLHLTDGSYIDVMICKIRTAHVRIGVEAPKEVTIERITVDKHCDKGTGKNECCDLTDRCTDEDAAGLAGSVHTP